MSRFHLLEEPWVPCVEKDGKRGEFSLAESLLRAHEFVDIDDDSPLVKAALYRLHLAVLHRVFGPRDPAAWGELWRARRFAEEPLRRYWEKWWNRFDLFDDEYPFFQAGWVDAKNKTIPIAKLDFSRAAGHNATLFDHSHRHEIQRIPAAEASRLLLAHQLACLGGATGAVETKGEKRGEDGLVARGAFAFLKGRNLFETLLLNLNEYRCGDNDRAIWEVEAAKVGERRTVHGRICLLTWPSRVIRLHAIKTDRGMVVDRLSLAPGAQARNRDSVLEMEAHQVIVRNNNEKRTGLRAVRVTEKKAVWRDSESILLPETRQQETSLHRMNWVRRLLEEGELDEPFESTVEVLGIASHQQKIELWRSSRLPVRGPMMEKEEIRGVLLHAVDYAEEVGMVLRRASVAMAKALAGEDEKKHKRKKDGKAEAGLNLVNRIETNYWGRLQLPYLQLLNSACAAEGGWDPMIEDWERTARRGARTAFEECSTGLNSSIRGLRAAALGARELMKMPVVSRVESSGTQQGREDKESEKQ